MMPEAPSPFARELHRAQHPDPWIGKSQSIRVWNIFVLGPGAMYVGATGKFHPALRALSLAAGPLVMWRNWHNYHRLEAQREIEGRAEEWWEDPRAVTSQGFRIMDYSVLGPLLIYTALVGPRSMTPALRRFTYWTGAVTVAYNLRNYLSVQARGEKAPL